MRNITITNGVDTVTLLKDLVFTISPQNVGAQATMASGKTVMDVVGIKNVLVIPTGWLSPSDLATLKSMISNDHILTVTYPDVDGPKTKKFFVEHPVYKTFKYGADGVDQWYGVSLTMKQQGVD